VIVNPHAGHGRAARIWPAVERELRRRDIAFKAVFTEGPGDATGIAASAASSGADLVVAVGGDGTANEVVNGLLAEPSAPTPALGVISCGSGCDLVRSLGIPKGVGAVEVLARGHLDQIDVGRAVYRAPDGQMESRYFVNAGDLGLGAEVAERVNRNGKPLGGFLSFLGNAVVTLLGAQFKSIAYTSDGGEVTLARAGLVFVANGAYAGGGMHFAPRSRMDDGLFDVVVLGEVSKPALLADLLPRVYRGTHLDHPAVVHYQAREVSVMSTDRLLLEIDGEQPGEAPASFSILPRALRVVVP
jgi:YegS/Rv2252/BmrU family lipid kinase